jgi:hypothetical protein
MDAEGGGALGVEEAAGGEEEQQVARRDGVSGHGGSWGESDEEV